MTKKIETVAKTEQGSSLMSTQWLVVRKADNEEDFVLITSSELKTAVQAVFDNCEVVEGLETPIELVLCDHNGERYLYQCGDYEYLIESIEVRRCDCGCQEAR